jgi:putative ABC transport system permease protein
VTRLAWSQLRFRTNRALALLVGMLLATTAFTVLTAASRTAQAREIGTVSAHFAPAYDILVRPRGSRTALEAHNKTVQPNFLAGIYGGITMDQYHTIAGIPGVEVAAPVAMVGYALLGTNISWPLPAANLAQPGRQLYRTTTTWVSGNGTTRVVQPPSYMYVTPRPLRFDSASTGGSEEVLPGGSTVAVCPYEVPQAGDNPFGPAVQSTSDCWSKVNHYAPPPGVTLPDNPNWDTSWVLPVLIAAIDPAAEAKLDGLNHAVISGSYLSENATDGQPSQDTTAFPVLAASQSGISEYAVSQLQELAAPATPPRMTIDWLTREAPITGRTLAVERTTADQAYQSLLTALREKGLTMEAVNGYWSVGPVRFQRTASSRVRSWSGSSTPPRQRRLTRSPGYRSAMSRSRLLRLMPRVAPRCTALTCCPIRISAGWSASQSTWSRRSRRCPHCRTLVITGTTCRSVIRSA